MFDVLNLFKRIYNKIYIIYKGRLLQNALTDNRISINELIGAMREQGIFDISEVGYGILEQNGTFSFYKADGDFATGSPHSISFVSS